MFETNVFCIDRFENIPKKKREKKILIHKVCAQAMIPYKNWNGIKFFRSIVFLFFWKFFDYEWNWIILNWIRISIRDHSTRDAFLHVQGRERYSFKYRIGSKIILVKDRENLRVSLLALLISIRSRCLSRLVKSKPRLLPSHFSFLLPLPPPRSFFRQHAARKCERISIHPRTCLVIIIYKNETLGKMEACRVSPVSFPGTDETFATTESQTRRDRIQRPKWKSQRELARLFHFVRTSFSRQEFACISSRLESFALRGHYLFRFRASSPTLPLPTGQNNRNYRRKLVISRCRDFTESAKTGIYIYREREGVRERIERGSRDVLRRKEEILSPRRKSKQLSSANIRGGGTCLQGLSKEQIYRRIDSSQSNESRSHRRLRRSLPPLFIRVHFLKGTSEESWRKMEETRNFINVQII